MNILNATLNSKKKRYNNIESSYTNETNNE